MIRKILLALALVVVPACAHTTNAIQPSAPAVSAPASASPHAHEMLSNLVGRWVLTGTIAGQSVVHDVEGTWTLQNTYVRLDEVSREREADGRPSYEATIFVGWLEGPRHYTCIWLDNTEVASGEVTCTAADAPDAIPFQFRDAQGALMIATTFTYHPADDSWDWRIDDVQGDHTETFATLTMRRQ